LSRPTPHIENLEDEMSRADVSDDIGTSASGNRPQRLDGGHGVQITGRNVGIGWQIDFLVGTAAARWRLDPSRGDSL
jgi:hypothetical protein